MYVYCEHVGTLCLILQRLRKERRRTMIGLQNGTGVPMCKPTWKTWEQILSSTVMPITTHTTRLRLIGLQVTCSDAAYLLLPSPRTNWVRPEQTANQSQIINSVGPAQKTWFKLVQPSNDQGVCTLIWFHLVADANTCYENAGCRSREVVKSRKKM